MPDVRLIDANALQRAFDDAHKDKPDFFCCNFLNNAGNPSTEWDCVDEILENATTIDAQPVKHGRFVFEKGDYRNTVDGYRCTSCGETYHTKVPYFSEYKFCPNCGAKMDGDADETT